MRVELSKMFSLLIVLLSALVASGDAARGKTTTVKIFVNINQTFQVIDGFGASNAFNTKRPQIPDDMYELFFSQEKGIGLTLLRAQVPFDGSCISAPGSSLPADTLACAGGNKSVTDIRVANSYGVKVWSAPWSPPAAYKTNGKTVGGSIRADKFADYSAYLLNYLKSVKLESGVELYALSVQNEPDHIGPYEGCAWSPNQMRTFIDNYLGPSINVTGVKIMMPEVAGPGRLKPYVANGLSKYVSIIGVHNYDGNVPARSSNKFAPVAYWQTETCSLGAIRNRSPRKGAWDTSMEDALMWAAYIHGWIVNAQANSWSWWWLMAWAEKKFRQNQALANQNKVVARRAHVIGNFAKFVRPGFLRVQATDKPSPDVSVSAYRSSDKGTIVLVMINFSKNRVEADCNLAIGFSLGSMTPWVTAVDSKLLPQTPVNITFNQEKPFDNTFTAILRPFSVTSYVFKAT